MGQQVGTAVGFVAGFFLPGGPQVWAGIGGIVGGAIKPEVIPGPRIGEIQTQTAAEGGPRPIIFGRSQPIAGNIIVDSKPRKVQKKAGKGAPEQQEPEQVYRTYAVGICRGPISDILQVWRNGTLVYDLEDPGMAADNELFLETARFYLGTFDQMPSPDLEAIKGVGNVHGYRGTCYMVLADENLTDTRGMWAQWQFRVARFPDAVPGQWWAIRPAEPPEDSDRYVWRSSTPEGFSTSEYRGPPNLRLGGTLFGSGIVRTAEGVVIVHGSDGQIELYSEFNETLPTPTIATIYEGAFNLQRLKTFGPIAIAQTSEPGVYYTAEHPYTTWTSRNAPDAALILRSMCQLENGTWVAFFSVGGDLRLCKSGSVLPEGWTEVDSTFYPSVSSDMVAVGNVAIVFSTNGRVMRSNGGDGWVISATETVPITHVGTGAWSNGDVAVFVDTNNTNACITQSAGVTWNTVDVGQTSRSVKYGNGAWVLSGRPTQPTIIVSRDNFATFNSVPMPGAAESDRNYLVTFVSATVDYRDSLYPLALIIAELSEQVSMTTAMFDVTLLAEYQCRGLTITNTYPVYKILETLSQDFFFMPSNVSGRVKFVPFGADTVATITDDDLVYDEDAEFEDDTRISDSLVVPPKLHLNYFDVLGGLNTDKQSSERPRNGRNYSEQSMQTPVTLSADEAATRVAKTHAMMVEQQRGEFRFSLPDNWLRLTETDPVFFQRDGKTDRLVLTRVDTQDGYQDYTAVRDRQSIHSLQVEGYPPAPVTRPPSRVTGPTVIEVIDGPLWRDADDRLGLFVAVSGVFPAWSGTRVELSIDGGATYIASASTTTAATMGTVTSVMSDHPQAYPDTVSTVQVSISTPGAGLETTDLAGMLNLRNLALIGDEYVNFADTDEVSPGLWDLSYFLRGRKGTSTEQHEIGERFVLLNGGVIFVPIELAYLNHSLTFRATSFGTSVDDATITTITFTGGTQIEREPGYLSVHPDGTDLVIEWQGVGRLGAGVNARMGVNFSGYFVTVTDGTLTNTYNVAVGTETLTVPFAAYTGPITISVQQRNQFTGLGPATQVIYANP